MTCPTVRTLTLNPSIDISSETARVEPTVKLRMVGERLDAGGGGINVARVLHRFDVAVEAVYLAGGATGQVLERLLEREGLPNQSIEIDGDTRTSLTIHATATGEEYRFVPQGPLVSAEEIARAIAATTDCASPWLVASGSLPRGASDDIYANLRATLPAETKLILDTSGAALAHALASGGLFLIKASADEFAAATGAATADDSAIAARARELVAAGKAEQVAVSFGRGGALLANEDGAWFVPAIPVEIESTVGAGDSFLAGMVFAFASGMSARDALRWGSAAGAATVATPRTGLCSRAEAEALLPRVTDPRPL